MLFNFFRQPDHGLTLKWRLLPTKYPKNNKNNFGGRALLPQRVIEDLVNLQIPAPYTFEVSHNNRLYVSHTGVLEFTANTEEIVLPEWLYQQLDMEMCGLITVTYKQLRHGRSIKLLPHSVDFLDVEHPKQELEKCLVNYQVLTRGDEIVCHFNEYGVMRFTVSQIDPDDDAIYIVDIDLIVEFLPPIGYQEKLENEKTVTKYVKFTDIENESEKCIEMEERGVCFDF